MKEHNLNLFDIYLKLDKFENDMIELSEFKILLYEIIGC
jgi:hypothetical protein